MEPGSTTGPASPSVTISISTVVSDVVDQTFQFMTVDWDGRIRMDPSSSYAMQRLIGLKDRFDIAFGCDTDHDRHGIVTRSGGCFLPITTLRPPCSISSNTGRRWRTGAAIGKTVVSSQMIDRVTREAGPETLRGAGRIQMVRRRPARRLSRFRRRRERGCVVRPSGRQRVDDRQGWNRPGPARGRRSRRGWTAIPARSTANSRASSANRCTTALRRRPPRAQRERLERLSPQQVRSTDLAGEAIQAILTRAPGNGAPIGGLKVVTESGWFAARPSGTEDIYKIYAESFRGADHLRRILEEAQALVSDTLAAPSETDGHITP